MTFLQVFLVGFTVSYAGSVPPGTINVSVMQLAIQHQRRAAIFLGLGASLVEFFYAGLTVKFQQLLSTKGDLSVYFQLITAGVLIALGVYNLLSNTKSDNFMRSGKVRGRAGFLRGATLGMLNPMTIPFWLAVTVYLDSRDWIALNGPFFWFYVVGISAGTFTLMITVDILGNKFRQIADNPWIVHKIPGVLFIGLGIFNLIEFL